MAEIRRLVSVLSVGTTEVEAAGAVADTGEALLAVFPGLAMDEDAEAPAVGMCDRRGGSWNRVSSTEKVASVGEADDFGAEGVGGEDGDAGAGSGLVAGALAKASRAFGERAALSGVSSFAWNSESEDLDLATSTSAFIFSSSALAFAASAFAWNSSESSDLEQLVSDIPRARGRHSATRARRFSFCVWFVSGWLFIVTFMWEWT